MKKQKGFSLVGILMAIVIIAALYYASMKFYSPKKAFNKETQKALAEQGIDIDKYKDMIDTAKDKVEEINKKIKKREKELQKFK